MDDRNSVKGAVSYGTAATVAICSAAFGIIGTWAVLDGPAQQLIVNNGSVADWFAAIGTWMIGVAATFVAVLTFSHGKNQSIVMRKSLLEGAQIAIFDVISLKLATDEFLKADESDQTWDQLKEMLRELYSAAEPVKIEPSAMPYISHGIHRELMMLNRRLRNLRLLISEITENEDPGVQPSEFIGNNVMRQIKAIGEYVDIIDEACRGYYNMIDAEL